MGPALLLWFSVLTPAYGMMVAGMDNKFYWCPPKFLRIGNSCYHISKDKAGWREAYYKCQDMENSELAILDRRWEDQNMRIMLNRREVANAERWIGGIYDWKRNIWVWGSNGRRVKYQAFSRREVGADYKWNCIIMDPNMLYRWSSRSCVEKKHYICETPLQMLDKTQKPRKKKGRKGRKGRRKNRKRTNKCKDPLETNSTL